MQLKRGREGQETPGARGPGETRKERILLRLHRMGGTLTADVAGPWLSVTPRTAYDDLIDLVREGWLKAENKRRGSRGPRGKAFSIDLTRSGEVGALCEKLLREQHDVFEGGRPVSRSLAYVALWRRIAPEDAIGLLDGPPILLELAGTTGSDRPVMVTNIPEEVLRAVKPDAALATRLVLGADGAVVLGPSAKDPSAAELLQAVAAVRGTVNLVAIDARRGDWPAVTLRSLEKVLGEPGSRGVEPRAAGGSDEDDADRLLGLMSGWRWVMVVIGLAALEPEGRMLHCALSSARDRIGSEFTLIAQVRDLESRTAMELLVSKSKDSLPDTRRSSTKAAESGRRKATGTTAWDPNDPDSWG